jgi:lactobin A/cerein 7B family class IIb bacteriocin
MTKLDNDIRELNTEPMKNDTSELGSNELDAVTGGRIPLISMVVHPPILGVALGVAAY